MSAPRPGFVHRTAVIGEPPEHREWKLGSTLWPPLIHETAQISAFVTVDGGREYSTIIGAGTFLMAHSHIGHDSVVGRDCELAAGVIVGGHCNIGDRVRIGVNACVRPFITIADDARIGAGAVVVKDVPAGEVWAGNPARKLGKTITEAWLELGRTVSESFEEMPESERLAWEEWWAASRPVVK